MSGRIADRANCPYQQFSHIRFLSSPSVVDKGCLCLSETIFELFSVSLPRLLSFPLVRYLESNCPISSWNSICVLSLEHLISETSLVRNWDLTAITWLPQTRSRNFSADCNMMLRNPTNCHSRLGAGGPQWKDVKEKSMLPSCWTAVTSLV